MKKVFTVLLFAIPIFTTYSFAQGNQQINSDLNVDLSDKPTKKLSYFVLADVTFANKDLDVFLDLLGVDLGFKGGRVGGFISLKLDASGEFVAKSRLGLNVGYCVLPDLMPYVGIGIVMEEYVGDLIVSFNYTRPNNLIAGEAGVLITPRGIPLALKVGVDFFRDVAASHLTVGVGFYLKGS
ncbi:hypothetical protein [Xanthovirga aplysinae]|uniref:hypothetical protein n=1 Tax=Xanthovirga aplysinae TaxID=2529853 RepID=UPI0012BB8260|nr:hypothetical protein [Xanthovirga aplysinae]MTI30508.1 hypothetical protein [Xanthovirga aplysinae]